VPNAESGRGWKVPLSPSVVTPCTRVRYRHGSSAQELIHGRQRQAGTALAVGEVVNSTARGLRDLDKEILQSLSGWLVIDVQHLFSRSLHGEGRVYG